MKRNTPAQSPPFVAILFTTTVVLAMLAISIGCDSKGKKSGTFDDKNSGKPVVAVSNYPLRFFVERIAGDHVDVIYPVDVDGDPAFWEPTSEAIAQFQKADCVFLNGAGYEKWLTGVTLSESKMVDTTAGSTDSLIEVKEDVVHQHGPDGEHTHGATAFTTWLDPDLAIIQAGVIRNRLAEMMPEHKADFDAALKKLVTDLQTLRLEMRSIGDLLKGKHLMGSHPVYQYLERTIGFDMHSVHFEPDENPTPGQWKGFDATVAENPSTLMLWEAEPTADTRKKLMARDIQIVVFDQMGNLPSSGDLISGMKENLKRLREAASN